MGKRTAPAGLGSLATGAVTALAIAVQSGLAAVVGVVIAREIGRGAETDGFFAAYGVFIVLALAATAIRLVVLPPLARARVERRLGQETAAWAVAFAVLAVPVLVLAVAAARPVAALLTGFGPDRARDAAEGLLPLMVLAAVLQLYAGLAASALAALDDYVTAAVSYIVASVVGLGYILVRIDADGIDAVAAGMALNGAVAVALPTLALGLRAPLRGDAAQRRPAGRAASSASGCSRPAGSVALPLALQAVYLICLPFAAQEGVGSATSFGYAYLAASALVAVTSSSLGLVTSVPLARIGLDPRRRRAPRRLVVVARPRRRGGGGRRVRGRRELARRRGARRQLPRRRRRGARPPDRAARAVDGLHGRVLGHAAAPVRPGAHAGTAARRAAGSSALHVPLAWLGQVLGGLAGLSLALAVTTARRAGGDAPPAPRGDGRR